MGKFFDGIDESLAAWISAQPMWFVATAPLASDGHVNLSPRSGGLSLLGTHSLAWVDSTGSSAETVAHLRENGRITLLWCSYDRRPRLVRVHGRGSVGLPGTAAYDEVLALSPDQPSPRAVVVVDVDRVSDSCGYGVPVMELVGERDLLRLGAEKRGPEGLAAYRAERNSVSLDGLPALDPPGAASGT